MSTVRRGGDTAPLEEAAPRIRELLLERKRRQVVVERIEAPRATVDIQILLPR